MKEKRAVIEKVYTKQNAGVLPTMLNFQNGSLSTVDKKNTRISLTTVKSTGAKGVLFATNEHAYHGLIDANSGVKEYTELYICIRNKITNQVKIMPMQEVLLKNTIYDKIQNAAVSQVSTDRAKDILMKEFGGRKAARYIHNKEKMKINTTILENDMNKTINSSSMLDMEEEDVNTRSEILMPKVNREAKKLKEVYNVFDVVPKDLIDKMDDEAKAVYNTPVSEIPIASEYLRSLIQEIQKTPQSAEDFLNIKLIIYMDCLLNLIKTRTRYMKKTELSRITCRVEVDVKERFSDPGAAFTRTPYSKSKATFYFIVLALLVNENFMIDKQEISKELNISQIRLIKFAQMLGAKALGKSIVLCLPGDVPANAHISRKRKL